MTAEQWLSATSPEPMMEFLRGKASDRKLRLYEVACVRNAWNRLTDPRSRRAVEVAESLSDGLASFDEAVDAENDGYDARDEYFDRGVLYGPGSQLSMAEIAASVVDYRPFDVDNLLFGHLPREDAVAHILLARDIFGNPFSPAHFAPSWRTSTVLALATQMYSSRSFEAMPMLADALQDAGCPDGSELIRHCRGPGPHVRGCHVLDIILQKT